MAGRGLKRMQSFLLSDQTVSIPFLLKIENQIHFAHKNYRDLDKRFVSPCLTDTYLELSAAMKAACGRESSKMKSSSLVAMCDRVLSTALEPMGAK